MQFKTFIRDTKYFCADFVLQKSLKAGRYLCLIQIFQRVEIRCYLQNVTLTFEDPISIQAEINHECGLVGSLKFARLLDTPSYGRIDGHYFHTRCPPLRKS